MCAFVLMGPLCRSASYGSWCVVDANEMRIGAAEICSVLVKTICSLCEHPDFSNRSLYLYMNIRQEHTTENEYTNILDT